MAIQFKKATKEQLKLRMALIGPAGSGKTYTALNIAQHLGSKVAVIDTEHGSASKYAGLFRFDVVEPTSFHPQMYIDGIAAAEQAGYDVLVIDSLSHAWMGKDGALELVDRAAKRSSTGNSFAAWRDVTPLHNNLIEAMLAARLHLIVTMRSKMEYVQDKDEKGRTQIRKVGLQPVQRDGLEYEFDVVADLDTDNNLVVGKTRCPELAGVVIARPGKEIADALNAWLSDGTPSAAPLPRAPQPAAAPVQNIAPQTSQPIPMQSAEEPSTVVIPFGKHKGKTLGDVIAEDQQYVQWIAANSNNARVKDAAQALLSAVVQTQSEPSAPTESSASTQATINNAQLRLLYALAKQNNITEDAFKSYAKTKHGVASSKDITKPMFDDIKLWLERGGQDSPAADAQQAEADPEWDVEPPAWLTGDDGEETFGDQVGSLPLN